MKNQNIMEVEGVERLPIKVYTEKAYLDYSMYVILDRALPHIGDGLKPVQRRIVYAMSELGLSALSKYKKAARTVGDVLGKFHPHGDSACYEAMVHMAQPFTYRYPLVDGQGNWGAPDDPKSFAAMRYTEARLSKFAEVLLRELGSGTVDWLPNFDGTLEEPEVLPARLPHVLLNGVTGIAVGMATDIVPHNVREVASACIRLLEDPKATIQQLCEHIKGPDFPTEAEIISSAEEIEKIYLNGIGSIRMRACYEKEGSDIIITALPHQISGAKILEQIATQMVAKKLPMIEDLRDESDHENPTRIVIIPRSNRVDVAALMSHLFVTTDLERTYRVNMNVIGLDGRPKVKNLRELLSEWLIFRMQTVTRRLNYRLEKVLNRLHVLDGLLVAFLNIDEVIKIVRSEDKPLPVLMKKFKISEIQGNAILDLKLRQLAKLEEIQIRSEQKGLDAERVDLEKLLKSKKRLKTLIRNEIKDDAETYGDDRRSVIIERDPAQAMNETDFITAEPITVIVSRKGWVRAAKGHEIDADGLAYKSGDGYKTSAHGKNNQNAQFIDSKGKVYALPAHTLPSARGQGEPLTGRLSPPEGSTFCGVMLGEGKDPYLMASDAGYGFLATLSDIYTKNKAGKSALSVPKGSLALPPQFVSDKHIDKIACFTNDGRLLVILCSEMPELVKGKGIKIINIPSAKSAAREEFVTFLRIISPKDKLTIFSGQRHFTLKPKDISHYQGDRGRRGNKLPRGFQRIDRVEVEKPE